jgi:phosphopantetheinyl transferase (holo-ACP synthase)
MREAAPRIALCRLAVSGVRKIDRPRQSRAARTALFSLLGTGWAVGHDPRGRPYVVDAEGCRGPDVSLGHAGDWAAAAVAAVGRIGVDVELPKPGRSVTAIAESVLTAPERALVAEGGEAALLACWTLREAAGKAIGSGLAGGLAVAGTVIRAAVDRPVAVAFEGGRLALACRPLAAGSLAVAWLAPARVEAQASTQGLAQALAALEPVAGAVPAGAIAWMEEADYDQPDVV